MRFGERVLLLIAPEIINPRSMPCVGLGYIGAYLQSKGRRVRIVDSQFTKEDPKPVLHSTPPTLVAIGVDSRTIERGLAIARYAKSCGHTTLLGGLHVSLVKEQVLQHPEVDFAIAGDGEIPTDRLVAALDGEVSFDDVPGLIRRDPQGQIIASTTTADIKNLDELPFPDYSLAGISEFSLYPLVTSRDCPYKCTYCTVGTISHGSFRHRSAESCVDEIVQAKEKYGIRGFLVVDENFSFRMDRAIEFCEELIRRRVDLPWSAFEGMRADALCRRPQILDTLRRARCRWLFFGIETAENAVLRVVRKGQKFAVIEEATARAREGGFKVGGFFIVGLPDATYQGDLVTIDWAMRSLDAATFWMSIPYYGTGLHNWVLENARLLRRPIGANLINSLSTMPFYDTEAYPAHLVKKAHTVGNLRSGITYFLDQVDREEWQRVAAGRDRAQASRRRLVSTVMRYDPSYLTSLDLGGRRADWEDPVAVAVRRAGEDGQPLPGDVAIAAHAGRLRAEHTA